MPVIWRPWDVKLTCGAAHLPRSSPHRPTLLPARSSSARRRSNKWSTTRHGQSTHMLCCTRVLWRIS
ncbi:hypothetical protein E2C01_067254 [Portunus trituberculatus]|uniref:Uncharacterized protein n=1 Tax=Portunus trituberculatus TaxID=210409 RepID=A0A5B7HKI0_PORTR|nr:hypothetical protein [Portunus trituberculatus]